MPDQGKLKTVLTEKMVIEYKKDTDLMFAVYQDKKTPNPGHFYDDFCKRFWQDIRPHE
jgi:hypothetical protein